MVREHMRYGRAAGRDQAYRVTEMPGRGAARADDVYFRFREGARPDRYRPGGHPDDHDPAGRRHQLDGLGQDPGLAAGLDDERRPLGFGPLAYPVVGYPVVGPAGVAGVGPAGVHLFGAQALGQVTA